MRTWGVIGRTAGSREEFNYSDTLKTAEFAWTPDRVDDWLANPNGYLPGNTMLIPEPVPHRDRLPMISFMMMETGGAVLYGGILPGRPTDDGAAEPAAE